MIRRTAVVLSFVAALALPGRLLAHEGHQHKIMGTVVKVDAEVAKQIEVKSTDLQTVFIIVDEKTKYLKGKAPASLKDVQVGSRIVATVTMEGSLTKASEIVVGEASGHDKQPHKH